ncbi:UNVERIFIED_ORG: transposase [Rhizobium etli]
MEVIMFGRAAVTRENLFAMPPHMRTECLALMRERGDSEDGIAKAFGVSRHAVRQIIDARHQFNLSSVAEERTAPEHIPETVLARAGIGRNALRVLRRLSAERGGWTAGKLKIARETGIPDGAVDAVLAELMGARLIVRMGEIGPGKAPNYAATPKGSALLASIMAEA